jgi:hypothetical protein
MNTSTLSKTSCRPECLSKSRSPRLVPMGKKGKSRTWVKGLGLPLEVREYVAGPRPLLRAAV